MNAIVPGTLLISDPFLKDPNFVRTAILICEHQTDGSFGFVLNRLFEQHLGELMQHFEDMYVPLYCGGPVQQDTVHFIHQRPDLITDGIEIIEGVFWGGNFELVTELVKQKKLLQKDIRFFIGYSGWSDGQLQEELDEKSWITTTASKNLIFSNQTDQIWKTALKSLGGEYELMVNYPINPQLN